MLATSAVPAGRRRAFWWLLAVALSGFALASLGLARNSDAGAQSREGGELRVLSAGDEDTLDPGSTYVNTGIAIALATQRPLLNYRPGDASRAVPDLAASSPEVAADGLSVTVRLKPGVRFSPPVNREVTSRDVKYAIERGFFSSVASPYAALYFGDIVGARADVRPGTTVPGIETPDDRTIVFRLSRPQAGTLIAALVMPLTAPVPLDYAARHDQRRRSTYAAHQVATGPYMVRNDARGRLTGYRPDRRIGLVRNPNWDAATDIRPARLDVIDIRQGNENSLRAARRILTGRRLVNGNVGVPVGELRRERQAHRGQFHLRRLRSGDLPSPQHEPGPVRRPRRPSRCRRRLRSRRSLAPRGRQAVGAGVAFHPAGRSRLRGSRRSPGSRARLRVGPGRQSRAGRAIPSPCGLPDGTLHAPAADRARCLRRSGRAQGGALHAPAVRAAGLPGATAPAGPGEALRALREPPRPPPRVPVRVVSRLPRRARAWSTRCSTASASAHGTTRTCRS
jgi:hypothetical protein